MIMMGFSLSQHDASASTVCRSSAQVTGQAAAKCAEWRAGHPLSASRTVSPRYMSTRPPTGSADTVDNFAGRRTNLVDAPLANTRSNL